MMRKNISVIIAQEHQQQCFNGIFVSVLVKRGSASFFDGKYEKIQQKPV